MKIVQINATCGIGSTGKICLEISKLLTEKKIENYILYGVGDSDYPLSFKCSSDKYIKEQAAISKIKGNYGFNSKAATESIIKKLDEIKPDIVHLHNLHSHNCNIEQLLNYLKNNNIKTFWTFHDCWAFTAYCTHFTLAGCNKWENGCNNCPQLKKYSLFSDKSKELYERKKRAVNGLNLTVITPSKWVESLAKRSFFKNFPIVTINNGIDLDVFKPVSSDFRKHYNCENKKIVLGVAYSWDYSKGLDVFAGLLKRLDRNKYQIVLVGTDDNTDKNLADNIISIHRTGSQSELAKIYSAADVFVNPTREDTFPTVNIEALACGTPGVTFRTGGSPECYDETCGAVVECNDIDALEREVKRICETEPYSENACVKRAGMFGKNKSFLEYVRLYENSLA